MALQEISFGKYKGTLLVDLLRDDRDYCIWLSKNKQLGNDEMHEFLAKSLDDEELDDESYRLSFGKHRGKKLSWIINHDPKYITWLKTNDYVQKNMPRLKRELEAITTDL